MVEKFEIFGWEMNSTTKAVMYFGVCIMFVIVVKVLYQKTKMKQYFPESGLILLLGIITGIILWLLDLE